MVAFVTVCLVRGIRSIISSIADYSTSRVAKYIRNWANKCPNRRRDGLLRQLIIIHDFNPY